MQNKRLDTGRDQERRRYSRVAFDHGGWLQVVNRRLPFEQMHNLSLGGACLKGDCMLGPGELCQLELQESGRHGSRVRKFSARVIRTGSGELALEFVDMDIDSYMFLQTMVLYHADDPLTVASEFQDDFTSPVSTATC